MNFDGEGDFVEIPYSDNMDRTGIEPFSLFAKVKISNGGYLFHTGDDGDPENSIAFILGDDYLEINYEYGSGTNYRVEPNTESLIGEWNTIAYTFDGTTLAFYLNGEKIAEGPS